MEGSGLVCDVSVFICCDSMGRVYLAKGGGGEFLTLYIEGSGLVYDVTVFIRCNAMGSVYLAGGGGVPDIVHGGFWVGV